MEVQKSVAKQNEMVLRLAKQVIATKTSNVVFSPALINVILSFIAASSPKATTDQILSLLNTGSTNELNIVSSEIVTRVLADSTASGGPTVSSANSVWIDKSFPFNLSFKHLAENSYKAAFTQVDFRTKADQVTEEINSWVEKQTNGLITDLLAPESVSCLTDVIFANALFFNARWVHQFDPSLTKHSDFHRLDGTKIRVPFMTFETSVFRLHVYQGFKVLNLPYRQGSYSQDHRWFKMQIYLPDEKHGLHAMLEKLASTVGILNGNEDIPSHTALIKELKIPRFKFAFDFEASDALKGLGLDLDLEAESHKIFHKSCTEVDEVGSKAAAASGDVMVGSAMPPEYKYDFVADHPFLFLVKEHTSNLVLFLGQLIDPSLH